MRARPLAWIVAAAWLAACDGDPRHASRPLAAGARVEDLDVMPDAMFVPSVRDEPFFASTMPLSLALRSQRLTWRARRKRRGTPVPAVPRQMVAHRRQPR